MLIFTFLVTIKSNGIELNDESQKTIHEFFNAMNEKDISNISKLLSNNEEINNLKIKLNYLEKISLKSISQEYSESLLKPYIKNNNIKRENIKIYKVKYYNKYVEKVPNDKFINGIHESWFYLTRENINSKWLIDSFDF